MNNYDIKVVGKGGISAKIIADSMSSDKIRLTTFELEYQRFFHSEVMTHRMLSKNSASSRAIPVSAMHENIVENTARPIYWGKNQPGMKAKEKLDEAAIEESILLWNAARDASLGFAKQLSDLGNHKQTVNRITEPFQMMKIVMTGTEFANFFHLRDHLDAQPEFRELAVCMKKAMGLSIPKFLRRGEWHLPYVKTVYSGNSVKYLSNDDSELTINEALKISASCCAQVSYRKLDDTKEKALKIFDMLNIGSSTNPAHASPLEHQAKVMRIASLHDDLDWEPGVTHIDRNWSAWSGNFRGWIQHRKLIQNEAVW